ncbi:FIST N-terminal domain-containing protein [Labilibaculum manganireducens]|uniref:FIST signal transduction protein n=1 Tax=Labilibaculum manganireducens TaxID=1940525 RepID=UPI0029F5C63A|nr:FIST N-terminal domain-containing protein [Labilibaculum manganireducens]
MEIEKLIISSRNEFSKIKEIRFKPDLLFIFGDGELMCEKEFKSTIKNSFPDAMIFGCSSSGEISGLEVFEKSISIAAVKFSSTKLRIESVDLTKYKNDIECGEKLCEKFPQKGLKHLMVLSDGITINGCNLLEGIQNKLSKKVAVTGGLAGDGTRFSETLVFDKEGVAKSNCVCALGFYGDSISIGYGTNGGWENFGIERLVTKSKGNILYELDHQPALLLYKQFLGERAKDLPVSGMSFPLSCRVGDSQNAVIRTVHGINEKDQSLIFGGNIPDGGYVKLMKANVDRLISGAELSAKASTDMIPKGESEFAVLISCVGRKLVLKQLVEEEVEVVADVIGKQAVLTGFYSYGEISPFKEDGPGFLHNQTMTITTFSEK